MKRRSVRTLTLMSILIALSLTTTGARVQVESDETADFSVYRTYAWKAGTPARNLNMEDRIVAYVEEQMNVKALERVDADPDLYVVTYVLPDQVSADELRNSGLEFWSGVTAFTPSDFGAGTLVIDLQDAETGKVVWRGVASKTLKGTFKKMERKVGKAIGKMFQLYPSP